MSHTTRIRGTSFIHDSDFGGYVEIVRGKKSLTIPSKDLEEFIACYVRDRLITKLERVSKNDILNLIRTAANK